MAATTNVDRDTIMLTYGLTECQRALENLAVVDELATSRDVRGEGVHVRENQRIFDQIRLGLQMAANVSRLFWPSEIGKKPEIERAKARGARLRAIARVPVDHGLRNRTLRNHIEHVDQRLDDWTAVSPRPFMTVEMVLHDDVPVGSAARADALGTVAIVYDASSEMVHLFGDSFHLPTLRRDLEEVLKKISAALGAIRGTPTTNGQLG